MHPPPSIDIFYMAFETGPATVYQSMGTIYSEFTYFELRPISPPLRLRQDPTLLP